MDVTTLHRTNHRRSDVRLRPLCIPPGTFHGVLPHGQEVRISRTRAKWTLAFRFWKASKWWKDAQGIASWICTKVERARIDFELVYIHGYNVGWWAQIIAIITCQVYFSSSQLGTMICGTNVAVLATCM